MPYASNTISNDGIKKWNAFYDILAHNGIDEKGEEKYIEISVDGWWKSLQHDDDSFNTQEICTKTAK